jgi:hypothetical protein
MITGLTGVPVIPVYATVFPAVPEIVNTAFCPEQTAGAEMVGAVGNGFTVSVTIKFTGVNVQVPSDTEVMVIVLFVVAPVTVTTTVPPAPMVTGLTGVPVIPVYATVFPAVPVMVNTAFCPEQIVGADIVGAVGNGFTVSVAVKLTGVNTHVP